MMLPPLIIKCVAKLWRSACVAWPVGRSGFTSLSICLKSEYDALPNNNPRLPSAMSFATSADTGTVRCLLLLVLTNVTRFCMMCSALSRAASPQRAPVLKQRTAIFLLSPSSLKSKCLISSSVRYPVSGTSSFNFFLPLIGCSDLLPVD